MVQAIGIAMGINGSDVAKQAADMVLADDNFASIVRAIKEGRRLFDNIQKFLLHLLSSNIAQVVLLMVGLAFKDVNGNSIFPMSPLEILWVNLVTSAPIALGLGLEPAVPDIMNRPPHPLSVGVFTWELIVDKMVYGCSIGAVCLAAFTIVVYGVGPRSSIHVFPVVTTPNPQANSSRSANAIPQHLPVLVLRCWFRDHLPAHLHSWAQLEGVRPLAYYLGMVRRLRLRCRPGPGSGSSAESWANYWPSSSRVHLCRTRDTHLAASTCSDLGLGNTSKKIIHVRSAGRHSILKIEIAIELYIHIYL
jgi:hypothetical protein